MPYRIISSCVSFWFPAFGMIAFYSLVMKKATKMEKNKLKMYNALNQVKQSIRDNGNKDVDESKVRKSLLPALRYANSRENRASRGSGEIIWKRKYKVSYQ